MVFSKSCVYGLRAIIYLAIKKDKKYVPIKEVSNELNISFHFLTKIFQELIHAGFVESVKGPGGGVGLKKDGSKITIYQIICVLDGDDVFEKCVLALPNCSNKNPCTLHELWHETKNHLQAELRSKSILAMAEKTINGELRIQDINTLKVMPKF